MASHSTSVTLKEFCPLYYLYSNIPVKIQKGFRSILVYLTALDTSSDYIAVGSSIGMLYLYCRQLGQMNKYNVQGKMEAITVVKLLSCFDDLVAVGTASGRVVIFHLVSSLPGRNKQLRRFDVVGLHKSTVTALAWSSNGMKLFSGDDRGKVVYSVVDLDQGLCIPKLLLEEPSAIVQLEYSQKILLLSSTQRSFLFYTQDNTIHQLGTKPRKSNGKFGACFYPALCKQSDMLIYATRPGLRLWRTDISGSVQDTYLLKELFARELPHFELFPNTSPVEGYSHTEWQLGLVTCFMKEDWVLTWNEYGVLVFDLLNQVIVGALEGCGDIVSVSCTENEIFVLRGDRDIIRISNRPEALTANCLQSPFSPMTNSALSFPHTGTVETAQPIRTMVVMSEQKDKKVDAKVQNEQDETSEHSQVTEGKCIVLDNQHVTDAADALGDGCSIEKCSCSSSITSWDSTLSLESVSEPSSYDLSSSRYSHITQEDLQQELVVKAVKVKKKAKRTRRESGKRNSEYNICTDVFGQEREHAEEASTATYGAETDCSRQNQPVYDPLEQEGVLNGVSHCSEHTSLTSPEPSQSSLGQCLNGSTSHQDSPCSSSCQVTVEQYTEVSESNGQDPLRPEELCCPTANTPDVDSLLECSFPYEKTFAEQGLAEVMDAPDVQGLPQDLETASMDTEKCTDSLGNTSSELVAQLHLLTEPEPPVSGDEEDIYGKSDLRSPCSNLVDGLQVPLFPGSKGKNYEQDAAKHHKSDLLAESWMGYSGPGYGILSLAVTDKFVWCLDMRGALYCSSLLGDGLHWQKFEDNVQQVAVSPTGTLLWKVEQKTNRAYACGKVTIKGKRHWYEAQSQVSFVALSDDSAWIICTNGDLYLQSGLSGDRPCARAIKVDCACPLVQIAARDSAVWALSEQRGVFYREGVSSFCPEGEQWKYDSVSERQGLEPVCISLGNQHTLWALDTKGDLWFRTGISAQKPKGEDEHWWQVSITDYVVFDPSCLFHTLIQATQSVATVTKAPVERVADRLRVAFWPQHPQCQLSLVSTNSSAVWIASSRNDLHVAKGKLSGTYWQTVLTRGTASTTKWAFVFCSVASTKEGSFLWLGQNRKDLLCVWDRDAELRPSTVQLPEGIEMVHLSACHDALWGVDGNGRIHIRTLSASCPTGMHWTLLDLSQLGHVRLVSVSCGGQNVWACDENGMVYFRVGTQPLNSSMMLPAWISIEPPSLPVGVYLVTVHTSPNDHMLWAVDSRRSVHVRSGITEEMPVGTHWEHIPGLQANELVVSLRTVWVKCPSGEVARRYGITDKNPAGDYWKKIPGMISRLSVTCEDELWAVSLSGALICRLTKTFQHNVSSSKISLGSINGEDLEDEWEVI